MTGHLIRQPEQVPSTHGYHFLSSGEAAVVAHDAAYLP